METIVHDDLGAEDMPIRRMIDVLMMATVDGKERSQVQSFCLPLTAQTCMGVCVPPQSGISCCCTCTLRATLRDAKDAAFSRRCTTSGGAVTEVTQLVFMSHADWLLRPAERLGAAAGKCGLQAAGSAEHARLLPHTHSEPGLMRGFSAVAEA